VALTLAENYRDVVSKHFTESYGRHNPDLTKDGKSVFTVGETELPRISVKEALNADDAAVLMPKIITGVMREAAEPVYVASQFFSTIRVQNGTSIEFPSVGLIQAHFVDEAQPYKAETLEFQRHRATFEVKVRKVGLLVKLTDEMIQDAEWDVIGMHLRYAGRAMARFKEEWLFKELYKHSHVFMDNASSDPNLHTTGLGPDGQPNNTLSVFDFIDLFAGLMYNGFVPTTLLIHPLVWAVFAKNDILGSLAQNVVFPGQNVAYPVKDIELGPQSIQSRLPFSFEIILTPFAPIDRVNRTFDMFLLDRDNVGAILVREDMSTDEFKDPIHDMTSFRVKERYSPGIYNEGRGIVQIRSVALTPSYNRPLLVKTA
jgi:hypothetical protein